MLNTKYWMICPECKGVLGKSDHGNMELKCSRCNTTWEIMVTDHEIRFVRNEVKDKQSA